MASEIRWIAPVRAANIIGVQYGLMMALMALFMSVMIGVMPTPEVQAGQPDSAEAFSMIRWFLWLYPVLGFVAGWIFGCAGAAAYNFLQRYTGGFLIEINAD